MLYYKNSQWEICTEKIRYMQNGEEIEQYVGQEGHGWWVEFANKWEHTEIIEFIPVTYTNEQLYRLNEINQLNIKDGYSNILGDYVLENKLPEGLNNPLDKLKLFKENEKLKLSQAEQFETVLQLLGF